MSLYKCVYCILYHMKLNRREYFVIAINYILILLILIRLCVLVVNEVMNCFLIS